MLVFALLTIDDTPWTFKRMKAVLRELEKRAYASGGEISREELARVCLFPDTFSV